jgi:Tol biopolymer transport system component
MAVPLLLAVAATLTVVDLTSRDSAGPPGLRRVTNNASEFSVSSGAISPDGQYVAYSDPLGIHIQTVVSGETKTVPQSGRLQAEATWDLVPGWLPDGTGLVANLAAADHVARTSIWIISLSDAPRPIRDRARALSVSPDGRWIAFTEEGDPAKSPGVSLMDRDGRGDHHLPGTDGAIRTSGVAWSPDGSHLAYARLDETGTANAIEIRARSGGPARTVFTADRSDIVSGIAWLRDGRLLYSVRRPTLGTDAGTSACTHWQRPLDNSGHPTGPPGRLAIRLPDCVAGLTLTADGKQALFRRWTVQDALHVATLDADGTGLVASPVRLTTTVGRNIPSGWTPDGGTVVFVTDRSGRPVLVRQSVDAHAPQPIVDEPGIVGAARLTPDGASVLYLAVSGRLASSTRIMRVPIEGGTAHQVVSGTFVDGGARCAVLPATLCAVAERKAGGRQLVFTAIDPFRGRVRPVGRLDVSRDDDYRWALSPDGTRIAVLSGREGRMTILSLTGPEKQHLVIGGKRAFGYFSWTGDGQHLLVPRVDPRSATLLAVDLLGNTRVLWEQPGAVDLSALPSVDGNRLLFWVRHLHANLWLAET